MPASLLQILGRAVGPGACLALVGGAVRDLLLHHVHNDPWRGVPDLDLVVEAPCAESPNGVPAAHRMARRLREALGPDVVRSYLEHGAYGTVELELCLDGAPVLLDVASARRERYPLPGENPMVSFGSLREDLARRDFTINAMALLLQPGEPDPCPDPTERHLLDPHGGRIDLEQRRLRFLHPGSVRDDPTRILRGARYAARMGFRLSAGSLEQVRSTLAVWPWNWRPGDPPGLAPPALGTRLRMELELLLEKEDWAAGLSALQSWGAFSLLDGALQADSGWRRRLSWAGRFGLPLLPALLAGAGDPLALAERLQVPHGQHRLVAQFLTLRRRLEGLDLRGWSPSRWCRLLEAPGASPEALALALAAGQSPRRPLLRWWLRWRHLPSPGRAEDLIAAGLRPGPELGVRLRELRDERLDRERL